MLPHQNQRNLHRQVRTNQRWRYMTYAIRYITAMNSRNTARAGHPVSYCAYLRLSFSRPSSGFFAVAAIPAARSFAIRPMSFTGTGLVSGKLDRPLSQLIAPEFIFERREKRPRCGKQRIVFLEAGEIQHRLSVQLVSGHAIPDALHCLRNGPPNRGAYLFELRPQRLGLRGNVLVNRLWNALFHTPHSMFRHAVYPRGCPRSNRGTRGRRARNGGRGGPTKGPAQLAPRLWGRSMHERTSSRVAGSREGACSWPHLGFRRLRSDLELSARPSSSSRRTGPPITCSRVCAPPSSHGRESSELGKARRKRRAGRFQLIERAVAVGSVQTSGL